MIKSTYQPIMLILPSIFLVLVGISFIGLAKVMIIGYVILHVGMALLSYVAEFNAAIIEQYVKRPGSFYVWVVYWVLIVTSLITFVAIYPSSFYSGIFVLGVISHLKMDNAIQKVLTTID